MEEIAPGIVHWSRVHPALGQPVHSYLLVDEHVALDPLEPEEGLDGLRARGGVDHVLLSCRHHRRDAFGIADALGATVHAARAGQREFGPDEPVELFDFGHELPGGVRALEVDAISPDEGAFFVAHLRALVVADGVIAGPDGALSFVPDELMDDPEDTKAGLRAAYGRIVESVEFEHLLMAHGAPRVGDGREALREFAAGA